MQEGAGMYACSRPLPIGARTQGVVGRSNKLYVGLPGFTRMNFIYGVTILLVYQLAGEVSVHFLQIPIPGPVMGMAMLFLTLLLRGDAGASLDTAASGLLSHLSLLFVPAGVGMIVHFNRIVDEWLPITVALVLGTVLTMTISAWVMLAGRRRFLAWTDKDE